MALILKISGLDTAKCTEMLLSDVTGDYDAMTNPGGWGTPNIAKGDVTTASMEIVMPDGTTYTVNVFDPPYEFPVVNSAMYLTPLIRGGSLVGNVTDATFDTPIEIECAAHGLTSSSYVYVTGVTGNTAANGFWGVTVVDVDHFILKGSRGNSAYISGGVIYEATDTDVTMPPGEYTITLTISDGIDDYSCVLHFLHKCQVVKCMSQFSYMINIQSCTPTDKLLFDELSAQLAAAQTQHDIGDYNSAEKLLLYVWETCKAKTDSGCGCN